MTIRLSQIIGIGLILVALRELKKRLSLTEALPLVYLIAGAASLLDAVSLKRGVLVLIYSIFAWGLFIAVSRFTEKADGRKLEELLWWTTLATIVFGFYQFFGDLFGLPNAATGLKEAYTKTVFGFPRIQSFALEPLYLANLLLIPLGIFATRTARSFSWSSGALTTLIVTTITMALSRGGYLATAVMVVIIALMLRNVREIVTMMACVFSGVIIGIALVYGGTAISNQQNINAIKNFSKQATNVENGASVSERAASRELALTAFKEHPIFGVGIGNFGPWAHQRDPEHFPETSIVNNEPLEILAETGIVGETGMVLFVVFLLRRSLIALKTIKARDPLWAPIVGLSATVIGFGVQYSTLSTLYITYIWVALGLLLGLQTKALSGESQSTNSKGPTKQ